MNPENLISIIIPVYNEELYLHECIHSILSQTYKNFECIFIDDGSTDKSLEIIRQYTKTDSRIKLFPQKHSGLIEGINAGLLKASGAIICRMDADDIMPFDRLELQLSELIKNGKGSLITGKVKYFSSDKISIGYLEYQNWLNSLDSHETYIKNCFIECPVPAPSWMMYKEDIEKLDYLDNNIYPEDYNFILKALINGIRFYSIDKCVLLWRDYPERTSKISVNYSRDNFWNVRAKYLPDFISKYTQYNSTVIFGVGSSGKSLCNALRKISFSPKAFIDIHPERIGKTVLNTRIYHVNETDEYKNSYILIALRNKILKNKLSEYLEKINKTAVKDYIFCC